MAVRTRRTIESGTACVSRPGSTHFSRCKKFSLEDWCLLNLETRDWTPLLRNPFNRRSTCVVASKFYFRPDGEIRQNWMAVSFTDPWVLYKHNNPSTIMKKTSEVWLCYGIHRIRFFLCDRGSRTEKMTCARADHRLLTLIQPLCTYGIDPLSTGRRLPWWRQWGSNFFRNQATKCVRVRYKTIIWSHCITSHIGVV